jgi:ribosomal protein L37AE/L43A
MVRPPDRCPNADCENSLGGQFDRAQFEKVEPGVWKCRECGYVWE